MGIICYRRGWVDEARRYYQTACQMDPGNLEYRQTLNYVENSVALHHGLDGVLREDEIPGHLDADIQVAVVDAADLHGDVPAVAGLPGAAVTGHAEEDLETVSADLCAVLEEALAAYTAMRETEGRRLAEDIATRCSGPARGSSRSPPSGPPRPGQSAGRCTWSRSMEKLAPRFGVDPIVMEGEET